jgi:hypothetical protein
MLNKEPKSWNDITIDQFLEIVFLKVEDFTSQLEYDANLLSIISDTSISIINDLDYDEFNRLNEKFKFIKVLPNKPPSKSITTVAGSLYLINDFNQLEIGAFIDLEHFFSNDYITNFKTILAILYRQKTIHNSPLILDEFEEYGNWIFHRAELFSEISILEVYNIFPQYLKFREEFFEKYDGLLSGPVEDDVEPIEGESIISKSKRIKDNKEGKKIQKWGWDLLLYQLANNDLTKLNDATKLNLIQAFNSLSMKREMGL